MNFSASDNVTVVKYRDTFATAVTKNVIVVALCISINYINGTLVHTFNKHQAHTLIPRMVKVKDCEKYLGTFKFKIFSVNPRYILFIHLVIDDMMQLLISTVLHVISYVFYTINVSFCCFLLIIAILTTLNTPLNLACMAVECYIAICIPLRHGQICTVKKTYVLIGLIWGTTAISILPDIFIMLATEQIQFFNSRVFCSRDDVFRSANSLEKRKVSHIVFLVVVWLTLFYTYFRILFAATSATVDVRKASNTILLHGFQLLLCMLTYVRPMFESAIMNLIPLQTLAIQFTCYIIIQILPRFVSPIIYGLRDQPFRMYVKRHLLCKISISPCTHTKYPICS